MNKEDVFKPRARLILQLGDELIKNESIALLELVKNSYDAGATTVTINMKELGDEKKGEISILDDGCGMDEVLIREVWLQPGSDYKKNLHDKQEGVIYRKPLGEKGIGRFSVHKLGDSMELISRMANKEEIYVKINWTDFEKAEYIDDVHITVNIRKPELFTDEKTGTFIKINQLRPNQWSDDALKEIYRSVNTICSPFDTVESFNVVFKTDRPELFKEIPTVDDIKKLALYSFYCEIAQDRITRFSYKFQPYTSMPLLSERKLTYNIEGIKDTFVDFQKIEQIRGNPIRNAVTGKKESPVIDLSANNLDIGTVKFEGLIFSRERKILKYANTESRTLTDYLDQNGGVRVYRDGIRVYDYGERDNDWLGLEKSRVYDPGVKLNKTLILAAVHLDRETSSDLIEKTNREGFVENDAYRALRQAVLYSIKIIETCRNEDKGQLRLHYGLSPKSEPILGSVSDLRELVDTQIKDEKLQKECNKYLDSIEKEYEEINEILMVSAEAGLNLSVAIHEIEKMTAELKQAARAEKSPERVIKLIERLAELIEMYATLIRKSKNKSEDLKVLISDALFSVHYRLKAHDIEVIKQYSEFNGNSVIKCSSRLVIGAILNLIDNSIYWLDRDGIKSKKVIIMLNEIDQKYIEVLVADNGKGFALPPQQMIKPFVGLKPGGMGLGLHIASEILSAQGGRIEFREPSDTNLPKEFNTGAIISLIFKKKEEN